MIDREKIKYLMDLLEEEIDETNSNEAKERWLNYANLYMADETDNLIERKCQQYYMELIDDDYNAMWNRFYLAQSLQACKDNDPKIIELYNAILDDKRSELNDLASIALYHLGEAYRDGLGTDIDYKQAYECFRKGIETNNLADNYIHIGDFYLEGKYLEQNYDKAFEYYLKAYEKTLSHPSTLDNRRLSRALALYKLGKCFEQGFGVKKNLDKALDYYIDSKDVYDISHFYDVNLGINEVLLEKRSYVVE